MSTYNTGNPVGSVDVKDLYDNAQNLDRLVNDRSITQYPDRLDNPRKTWWGMEQDFYQFLLNSQFEYPPLNYVDGTPLTINRPTQLVQRSGQLYRVLLPATFPVNLTGTWATDAPLLTAMSDTALRQDLADRVNPLSGAAIVGRALRFFKSVYAADGIADGELKSVAGQYDGESVLVLSRRIGGPEAGGGHFIWRATSTATANNATTVQVTGVATGRWIRQFTGPLMAEWFGAEAFVIGSTQDSTAAFNAVATAAGQGGEGRWTGHHRITGTVNIPLNQTFGSFGMIYTPVVGNLTNWSGIHNGGGTQFPGAIFYDKTTGSAFSCQSGACPTDFTIYTAFSAAAMGTNVMGSNLIAAYNDVTAFAYNKFISPRNISISHFRYCFNSFGFDSLQGNYYSNFYNVEIVRAFCAFRFRDTAAYNFKIYGAKFTQLSRFIDTTVDIKNFAMFGGSVEGWTEASTIPGASGLSFFGTYFETTYGTSVTAIFAAASGSRISVCLKGCTVYLNNTVYAVYFPDDAVGGALISMGNNFILTNTDITPSHNVFRLTALQTFSLVNDTVGSDSTGTISYSNNYVDAKLYAPPAVLYGTVSIDPAARISGTTGAVGSKTLSAAPASPTSGVVYWANGGSWNPLSKAGGFAYPVIWRGAWEQL